MAKRQRRLVSAVLVSILLSTVPTARGREESQRSGWLQLDLVKTTMAGTTVYYEEALEPNLPVFERHLRAFLDKRIGASDLLGRKEEIVTDINHILGAVDVNSTEQGKMLAHFASIFTEERPTFYLVSTATIKDFLRAGGQLPDCTYNRSKDEGLYLPRVLFSSQEGFLEECDLCLPIPADVPFDEYVSTVLQSTFGGFLTKSMCVAIHEVTELTLLRYAQPTDTYWRWFSDGCAEAITYILVEKYLGRETAQGYVTRDLESFRDLEKEVNLAYWMMAAVDPFGIENIPIESEQQLLLARYAYSMFEAQRLIDEHGIECVREILDEIVARDSRSGSDLLDAIEEVTGEDMAARLAHYQNFATREEGIARYAAMGNAAEPEDWETLLVVTLRVNELRGDVFSSNYLLGFKNIALFLFRMGYESSADSVMQRALELYSRGPREGGREKALTMFVSHALDCHDPSKAEEEAKELLEMNPDNCAALTAEMLLANSRGNLNEAKEIARRIQSLIGAQTDAYKIAEKVLAIDANTPGQAVP